MNQDNSIKKDYIWNTIGSAVYALSAVILAFLAMHYAGPDEGGIFGFGFSTFGQQMFIIAYFGIRPFHITDAKHEYAYEDYRKLRVLTAGAACAAAALYLLLMMALGHYNAHKASIIFALALYKIADGIADLYESECQREGKLYLGGQELTVRTILAVIAFALVLITTGSLLPAACAAVAVHAAVILFFRAYVKRKVVNAAVVDSAENAVEPSGPADEKTVKASSAANADSPKASAGTEGSVNTGIGSSGLLTPQARALFMSTVLLFLSVFVDFYIFSASKYAIDLHLTDADSGIFNILFMPTSVIYLVANFIIRPYMTRLAEIYEKADFPRYQKIIRILAVYIVILSALAIGGTLVVGRWVLVLFEGILGEQYYGELIKHHWDFVLIIAGGCCYAMTNLFYYILIIMRQQKMIFFNYVLMAVVAYILTRRAVTGFGMEGAATAYPLYMLLTMLVFISTYHKELRKEKERRSEETQNYGGFPKR